MKSVPPIVAGVDFSSTSNQVLAHAGKIAGASGARVIAAHVIGSSAIKEWEKTMGSEAFTSQRVEEMSTRLKELVGELCPGMPYDIEVRVGNPPKVLAQIVTEYAAGLLIIGANDMTKRRLGSVAAPCARSAPTDVLILRDWQGRFFHRIAACVDFSPSCAAALDRAIALAKVHGAYLEIIHVIFPPGRDPWGRVMEQPMTAGTSYEHRVWERARAQLNEFLRPFSGQLAGIQSSIEILEGECPAAAITAHVEAAGIDLTVTGSREGSWVADIVLGSNTERLLQDSSSSVLIARA